METNSLIRSSVVWDVESHIGPVRSNGLGVVGIAHPYVVTSEGDGTDLAHG